MCVLIYESSNGCFMIGVALTDDHYMTYIICSVGHYRSNSVGLLVLWMIVYNGRGTDIVLQVPRNSANWPDEK